VADLRAPTPSAAMQMILPDENELYQTLDAIASQYKQIIQRNIFTKTQTLEHLKSSYLQHSVEKKLAQRVQDVLQLKESFQQRVVFRFQGFSRDIAQIKSSYPQTIESVIRNAESKIAHLQRMLESNHPKLKSKKGFAQISQNAKVIDIAVLKKGDIFEAQSERVVVSAKVLEAKEL
jgi:exodeoxyribonuclease VII large subunit